ncbi:TPA: DUF1542 domain-containing protein, partial [Streptococcus suis]
MSSKDMFRKEQRFSFRKFSFGLASAVIANVIFGGAIASSPVVHANTATETAAVAASERTASLSYTVNIVDQAGKVVDTQTKTVSVKTTETTASTTAYLTTDLVPTGYALVSGLGQVTVTENATNVFTVQVEEIVSEAASTAASESATSTAVASETATSESATATSEVAASETATTASETSAKKAERTAYLSYVTQYVNEEKEIVDSKGHLVAVTTTDETAKTQVTVSASENMPAGYELAQEKAEVVLQLVENQANVLAFAVAKKSEEEEIAESQLSNRDVLTQVTSEADLLADEALRQVAGEQAGNTALETAANDTKAAAATANQVLANAAATETELGAHIDTVRTSTQNLAAEMLKVDADGVLTAQLNTDSQAITITSSSTGAVRPDYANHIRAYATSAGQRLYNDQDFFLGFIGKELTVAKSKVSFTAVAADGSTPTLSILNAKKGEIGDSGSSASFGFKDTGVGVLSGTTTISDAGNGFSWWFKATSGSNTAEKQFTFVPYTVVKTDENPIRKTVTAGVTADEILAKIKSDVTRGNETSDTTEATAGALNIAFEQHFNSALTARATGKSTTVTEDAKNGKQIWHEIVGTLPTTAGTHNVTVRSTNIHGQTIDNTVTVILIGTPTVTANTDGTVTVTPSQTDGVTKKVDVTYTDETGVEKTVTATKEQDGNWTVPAGSEVTVDSSTGAVTIPANSVQNGSTVKAVAKDSTDYPSTEATAQALNPPTTVQDKQTIYVFNNTAIKTVDAGTNVDSSTADDKVKVVTLKDPDGIKSVEVGEDGLGNEYKVDAEGFASGKPSVSALGKHGRSFAVTDNQDQVTNVLTATADKQLTYVMDARATGEINKAAGESATAAEILAKVTVDPGNERAHIEGTADGNPKYRKVLAPGQTAPTKPGTHTVNVRVITASNVYKDVPVKVIIPKYSDTLTATAAENTSLVPGSGTAAKQLIVINDKNDNPTTAPADTTYEIDPAFKAEKEALGYEISVSPTGEVSVKAPAGQETDITVPVTVTYPDKTKDPDPVSVPFKVDQTSLAQLKATEALDEAATAAKKAIDNNPNLSDAEKTAAKKAVDADTEKAKQAVADATTIDEVDAAKEAGTTNVDGKLLAAAKQDAKNKIAEDVKAAKDAIDKNPNLSDAEKTAAKNAVDDAAKTANDAIDKATTPETVQTAEDNGVKAIDAKELDAAKQDAKNKIAEDVKAAKDAIDKNPNLSDAEKTVAKNAVDDAAKTANGEIDKATTPETVQTAEDNGVKAIDAKELDAAKQDAKNKIAEDVKAAKDAIDNNPNLSKEEKQTFKDAVDKAAETAN